MDEYDEQYQDGFAEGYEWGKFVGDALNDHEPPWLFFSLANAIGAIAELADTAEVRAIREAMVQGRDDWEETRK